MAGRRRGEQVWIGHSSNVLLGVQVDNVMNLEQTVTIASLFIGVSGFLFGVYAHFSTRKVAILRYEIVQLTDFGLPQAFLESLPAIPVMLTVYSVGNKKAEDINIRIRLATKAVSWNLESDEPCRETINRQQVQVLVRSLNPHERLRLSLQCKKELSVRNYVKRIKITHSEGIGVDVKALEARREKIFEMLISILRRFF